MEITVVGSVIIPLGLILFFLSKNLLYYVFIFFVPFSASSVINFETFTFGLQIPYYLGILWMTKVIITKLYNKNFTISKKDLTIVNLFIIFYLIAGISLFMPFIYKGTVDVHYPGAEQYHLPLSFSRINVTQFVYLTFVFIITLFIYFNVKRYKEIKTTIKILLISALFTALWGLFQFSSYYIGFEYPDFLFNNNIGFNQAFGQTIGFYKRVNSVAPEPSKYATYLLWITPLAIGLWIYKVKDILKKHHSLIISLVLFLVLIMTTSTTAYVVFFLFFIILLIHIIKPLNLVRNFNINRNIIKIFYISLLFILVIWLIVMFINNYLNIDLQSLITVFERVTIAKTETHSFSSRTESLIHSLKISLQSPLLGFGWGSHRSFDLISTLLVQIGFLGLIIFVSFIFKIIYQINTRISYQSKTQKGLGYSLQLSIITGLLAHSVAQPDIISLIIWVILGISLALIKINIKSI